MNKNMQQAESEGEQYHLNMLEDYMPILPCFYPGENRTRDATFIVFDGTIIVPGKITVSCCVNLFHNSTAV